MAFSTDSPIRVLDIIDFPLEDEEYAKKGLRVIYKDRGTGSRVMAFASTEYYNDPDIACEGPLEIYVEFFRLDKAGTPMTPDPELRIHVESMYRTFIGPGSMDCYDACWGEIEYQVCDKKRGNNKPLSRTGNILLLDSEDVFQVADAVWDGAYTASELAKALAAVCDILCPKKGLRVSDFVFYGNEYMIERDENWLELFEQDPQFQTFRLEQCMTCDAVPTSFISHTPIVGSDFNLEVSEPITRKDVPAIRASLEAIAEKTKP